MSDSYEGKDGLERDIAKLKYEWRFNYRPKMLPHWQRFKKARNKFHTGTNLFVESCRASPYFFGHVCMVYFCLNAVAWVANWIVWMVL